uniref:Uncharacterized protein n=1 Tax=Setaria italica TaxID=4555 RepID=K3Y406_SETIT
MPPPPPTGPPRATPRPDAARRAAAVHLRVPGRGTPASARA